MHVPLSALRGDTENTPLQLKLNRLAELIAQIGSAAGLLLFVALLIRFFVQLARKDPPRSVPVLREIRTILLRPL
jgi:P-type Ca2+ transporter type 2C